MPNTYDTREGPARFEIRDLRGMSPTQMRLARVEFHARATELHEGPDGEPRDKTPAEQREFRHCLALIDAIDAYVAFDSETRNAMKNPRAVERAGYGEAHQKARRSVEFMRQMDPWLAMSDIHRLGDDDARDRALAALEERGEDVGLDSTQLDQADRLMRSKLGPENPNLDGSYIARRTLITESPAYRSAFRELMTSTHPMLTAEEVEAVRAFRELESRAMSEGTTTAGGFGVPVTLDSSIVLTSGAGAAPLLDIARVEHVTNNVWKGVTAASMSWSWDAEGSAVSDDSPTLAQPSVNIYMMRGFIPYSIELGQDYPGFADEMARLLAQGSLDLLASTTATGSGSSQPYGVVTRLEATTTSRVRVTTAGSVGAVDVFSAWNALAERFRSQPKTAWAMSVSMESQIRSFSSANQSSAYFTVDLTQGGLTRLNGRPVTVTDYMPTYTSGNTSNTSFCVIGDWSSYLVAMRAGLNVEAIQTLFDTTTNRPIGSRGFFGYLRAGADVINTAGMKILDQT